MFDVTEAALLALQVAPATTAGAIIEERLEVSDGSGTSRAPAEEVGVEHGGRIHVVQASPGPLSISYAGALRAARERHSYRAQHDTVTSLDAMVALRQSRYCPSDALAGFATTEFGGSVGDTPDEIAL